MAEAGGVAPPAGGGDAGPPLGPGPWWGRGEAVRAGAGAGAGVLGAGLLRWGAGWAGMQCGAAGCLAFLGANWLAAGVERVREASGGGCGCPDEGTSSSAPTTRLGCTIIVPVKGCTSGRARNWRQHLVSQYPGPLELLYVVESQRDPAYAAVQLIRARADELKETSAGPRSVQVLVAGPARTCSQKLHNMLEGIRQSSAASEFVLFLDDDVLVHPRLVWDMQTAISSDPRAFVATGYPVDLVPSGSNLWAHAAAAFHLVLIPALSHGRSKFVWGGCMMFRREDLVRDSYRLVSTWSNGGYSDDLLAGAICIENSLKIMCPPSALLLQPLDGKWTATSFWNYMRRQLFVLATYSSPFSRRMHLALLCANALFYATVVIGLAVSALVVVPVGLFNSDLDAPPPHGSLAVVVWCAAFTALACLGLMCRANVAASAARLHEPPKCLHKWRFEWALVALGFLTMAAFSPPAAALAALCDTVTWSGIVYTKRRGRVVRIQPL